jgi:hypothetical protein
MEAKNYPPTMDNIFFVWEYLMQRFSEINNQLIYTMTREEIEEREKHFSHLRCIVLLVLSKMTKKLADNTCEKR